MLACSDLFVISPTSFLKGAKLTKAIARRAIAEIEVTAVREAMITRIW